MSKIATVTFTETTAPVPVGVTPAGRQAQLFLAGMPVGAAVPVDIDVPFTFSPTLPGVYHIEVSRISSEGTAVAAPAVSDTFTIVADQLMMNVPAVITVVLTDAATPPVAPL